MSEQEQREAAFVAKIEADLATAIVPDQTFNTGWEITGRNADGTVTGREKKSGKTHTTRRIDWSFLD